MVNPITDRLRLIETTHFEGFPLFGSMTIPWFDHAVPVRRDTTQVIYRGKKYIGIVYHPSHSDSLGDTHSTEPTLVKARKGDIIYHVSPTPQPFNFSGFIVTKDGYRRMYEIRLQMFVSDPKRCVECYLESKDPAALAIDQFKRSFEHYYTRFGYDEINRLRISPDEKLNEQLSSLCGIIVVHANWSTQADYQREKELEIQYKTELRKKELVAEIEATAFEIRKRAELKKTELSINADVKEREEEIKRRRDRLQKDLDRDEKRKQNDFVREEKIKSQLNEARLKLLATTVNDLAAINSERLRDAFDSNGLVRAVLEDSLKLIAVFTEPIRESKEVIDSPLLNEDTVANAEEEETGPITTSDPTPSFENGTTNSI